MKTKQKLPKRCRFFAACGAEPTKFAKHSFLGEVAVCDNCLKTNPYIRKTK